MEWAHARRDSEPVFERGAVDREPSILAVGLVLAPWADQFFDSAHRVFASENERAAGDFMWEVSSPLVGVVGWAIRDLIVGPTKK